PPGNPCSAPHRLWMYCDNARFGSNACAVLTKHNAASPASSRLAHPPPLYARCCFVMPSLEIFEFLNHHLGPVLQRDFSVAEDVKVHPDRFDAGGRNARHENVFGDSFRPTNSLAGFRVPNSLERYAPRFPTK